MPNNNNNNNNNNNKTKIKSMRKEFKFWIRSSIESMIRRDEVFYDGNYSDVSGEFSAVLEKFTDEDYEKVSDELTSALEDFLLQKGVPRNNAIRYAWKWSD